MAIVKCRECRKDVSSEAANCPHCGAPVKKPPKTFGCGTAVVLVVVIVGVLVAAMNVMSESSHRRVVAPNPAPTTANDVQACVDRGVAYFKEVGSYPTLKSLPDRGRKAEDVALGRCRRTTTAF